MSANLVLLIGGFMLYAAGVAMGPVSTMLDGEWQVRALRLGTRLLYAATVSYVASVLAALIL